MLVVEPLHYVTQAIIRCPVVAASTLLIGRIAVQIAAIALHCGGIGKFRPDRQPHASGLQPRIPAAFGRLVAVVVAVGIHLQVDGTTERDEEIWRIAETTRIDY